MTEKANKVPAVRCEDGSVVVDLAQPGSPLIRGLKEPVRTVDVRTGSIIYRVPKGADDPGPDNIVLAGAVYLNVDNGKIGLEREDVVG